MRKEWKSDFLATRTLRSAATSSFLRAFDQLWPALNDAASRTRCGDTTNAAAANAAGPRSRSFM